MSKKSEPVIKFCVHCGASLEGNDETCPKCGEEVVKIEKGKLNINSTSNSPDSPKNCPHCGTPFQDKQIYCSKCGKLVKGMRMQGTTQSKAGPTFTGAPKIRQDYSRKCPECGAIINSKILDQCPICNTLLEPLPESVKSAPEKEPGFMFTGKKLKTELKSDKWNLKEGLNVFINSLVIYLLLEFSIIIFFFYQTGIEESMTGVSQEMTMTLIVLSQLPGVLFGLTPIWYVFARNHSAQKLGLDSRSKSLILALVVGIIGGLVLIGVNYLTGFIHTFLYDLGLDFFDISSYMEEEQAILQGADFLWIFLLFILVAVQAISNEFVFRGVLHNTLKDSGKFNSGVLGRITIIILVALVYGLVYALFSLPVGIFFFILNFLVFIVLGILYEINGNIYNTIIASVLYNVVLLILMIYF